MIDPSLVANVISDTGAKALQPQPLPPPQTQDVMRFEDVMAGYGNTSSLAPSSADQPVLQIMESGQPEATSFKDLVIQKVTSLDSSYSTVVNQLVERPSLQDYFGDISGSLNKDNIKTYPGVGSSTKTEDIGEHFERLLQNIEDKQTAAVKYQQDMTGWTINAEMWMTTVNVLSSAVNQVAQGFKTLFRASG